MTTPEKSVMKRYFGRHLQIGGVALAALLSFGLGC